MTPPPTSIDGTEIAGATIDGQDVDEITIDGQTVFSAGTLPVAYSNLIAWYPFDSGEYGGSNGDDVTALFNPADSGDSTAFDFTVSGATYQSGGGVNDINIGPNSGAFKFDGSNDRMDRGPFNSPANLTLSFWGKLDTSSPADFSSFVTGKGVNDFQIDTKDGDIRFAGASGIDKINFRNIDTKFHHSAVTSDGSTIEIFSDGSSVGTVSGDINFDELILGTNRAENTFIDGVIDDVRVYNTVLSESQISTIEQNTQP